MMTNAFLDSFSGVVADLSKKEQGYPLKVLEALKKSPLVSTWDMSESKNLCSSIRFLLDNGTVKEIDEPYPWHRFQPIKEPNDD